MDGDPPGTLVNRLEYEAGRAFKRAHSARRTGIQNPGVGGAIAYEPVRMAVNDRVRLRKIRPQAGVPVFRRISVAVDDDQTAARQIKGSDSGQSPQQGVFTGRPFRQGVVVAAHRDDAVAWGERFQHGRGADVAGVNRDITGARQGRDARVQKTMRVRITG